MKLFSKLKKAVALGLTMAMAMSCVAFAADDVQTLASSPTTTGSITIDNAAKGETYSIYQIFEMTYSDEDEKNQAIESSSYSYKVNDAWVEFITNYEYTSGSKLFTLEQGTDGNYYVTADSGIFTASDEDVAKFARDALAYAKTNGIEADDSKAADDSGEVVFESLPLGYYLVDTSLGSLCFLDSTDADITIHEKNGTPTVEKYVHENTAAEGVYGADDDADNNSDVTFKVEIDNINGTVNLVLHDSMDEELKIPNSADFHMDSVTLYVDNNTEGIELVEGTDYTITVGDCTVADCNLTDCAFEIHFLREFNDVDDTGYIEITYKLHLNTDNDGFTGDEESIDNYAQVTFGTSSYSEPAKTETWVFGFEVYKYTVTGTETTSGGSTVNIEKALTGAEFELTDASEQKGYFTVNSYGEYVLEGWGDIPEGTDYTYTLISDDNGKIYIEGLDAGTYVLKETKAPDGYNMLTDTITVVIKETYGRDGLINGHTVTVDDVAVSNNTAKVENNAGLRLPSTGGTGTTMFYIAGICLIMGCAIAVVVRRRMRNTQ